jgi:hypothetical protein
MGESRSRHRGKDITIDAGSGSINLKANSVDVAVASSMNVH